MFSDPEILYRADLTPMRSRHRFAQEAAMMKAIEPSRRTAFYSHDTMGLGHTRRNLLIAQTLLESGACTDVLMITGMHEARAFPIPARMDFVTLPGLHKSGSGQYESRHLKLAMAELIPLRSSVILAALRAFDPDVFVVDNVPRGAARELEPALKYLRADHHARCVLGLRDVLDEPATVATEWNRLENQQAIRDYYDAVWVYGDPSVYHLADEYGFEAAVARKVRFTGYLDPRVRIGAAEMSDEARLVALSVPSSPFVLCEVGGGQDGARLLEAFVHTELPADFHGVILTGPFIPAEVDRHLRTAAAPNPRMHVLGFIADPSVLLRRARQVIAMGGYNTACEALAFGKPTLMVPRVKPRLEQWVRVTRFRDLGLVDMIHPHDATPQALARWIAEGGSSFAGARARVDMGGLVRLPALFTELLESQPNHRGLQRPHLLEEEGH
mgnify:CR=1 FL=1